MRYAIVINLDYDAHSTPECHRLWTQIKQRMLDADFRPEGRLFTIDLPSEEAGALARGIINEIGAELEQDGQDLFTYLKEFYGYDHTETVNLLLPPATNISLDEETG